MGDTIFAYRVLLGRYMRERDNLEDTDISGRIILRWIFRKCDVECMEWIDLAQDWGQVVGAREGSNEISGFHKIRGIS
jgi:hypothetical protein